MVQDFGVEGVDCVDLGFFEVSDCLFEVFLCCCICGFGLCVVEFLVQFEFEFVSCFVCKCYCDNFVDFGLFVVKYVDEVLDEFGCFVGIGSGFDEQIFVECCVYVIVGFLVDECV